MLNPEPTPKKPCADPAPPLQQMLVKPLAMSLFCAVLFPRSFRTNMENNYAPRPSEPIACTARGRAINPPPRQTTLTMTGDADGDGFRRGAANFLAIGPAWSHAARR